MTHLQALDQVIANLGVVLVPEEAWEGIVPPSFSVARSRSYGGAGDSPLGPCMNTLIRLEVLTLLADRRLREVGVRMRAGRVVDWHPLL